MWSNIKTKFRWYVGQLTGLNELSAQIVQLTWERDQAQQFEQIAAAKLKEWVEKHDNLLVQYKALQQTFL